MPGYWDMATNESGSMGLRNRIRHLLRRLGPGIISGASRNDPSSITAYAKIGAQVGYGLLWTLLFSYPLLAAIQEVSAMVGRVTGRGIAGNLRLHYGRWALYTVVSLLLVANTVNLGADIGAMGEAMRILVGGPSLLYSALFTLASIALQVGVSYAKYVALLKWLTLALFAYVASALVVNVDWPRALAHTLVPSVSFNPLQLTALVAALGATINPYLFFWQASQEVEEQNETPGEAPLIVAPEQAPEQIRRVEVDTYTGMAYANIIGFFILLTTAATLNARGVTDIRTAAGAAEALRPIGGNYAFLLFSLGIIGTGLLAVPVLAGSAAYAVGEAMNWRVSLACKPHQAKGFYGILIAAAFVGLAMNFARIDIIKALFWVAVLNGVIAAPVMVMLMVMTADRRVMGRYVIPWPLRALGWLATGVMLGATAGLFVGWAR